MLAHGDRSEVGSYCIIFALKLERPLLATSLTLSEPNLLGARCDHNHPACVVRLRQHREHEKANLSPEHGISRSFSDQVVGVQLRIAEATVCYRPLR
jgi:hypothetical protein